MADQLILLNKPFQVLCQFTDEVGRATLADYVTLPHIYPAGRLDFDSEGLVVLTNVGWLQHQITDPHHKLPKTYWVEVEGTPDTSALKSLSQGILLKDGMTKPAKVKVLATPQVWPRVPPIRVRQTIPTTWLALELTEGRNRQVRRMTAAVGHPTLRLIRQAIGPWQLGELQSGQWRAEACPKKLLAKPRLV